MDVKQITIFLENKPGRLTDALRALAEHDVNIRALSLAETTSFGVLRLIVNDPAKAVEVLKAAEFAVSETEVLAVGVTDEPGGLVSILDMLAAQEINIEYTYAFVEKCRNEAVVVLRVAQLAAARKILEDNGITLLTPEEVYTI